MNALNLQTLRPFSTSYENKTRRLSILLWLQDTIYQILLFELPHHEQMLIPNNLIITARFRFLLQWDQIFMKMISYRVSRTKKYCYKLLAYMEMKKFLIYFILQAIIFLQIHQIFLPHVHPALLLLGEAKMEFQ